MSVSRQTRPWTEKYRPQKLSGVAFHPNLVRVLQTSVSARQRESLGARAFDVPNLLFHGPPGTGKTSTILAIAREWFPDDAVYRERVLELNASDERGIKSVREIVIGFARQPVLPDAANRFPPFRLVILDEADAMTEKAQASLRRVMERYSSYTRFCLLCNYLSGLIAPLVSRCSAFYFRPPAPEKMFARLDAIARREKLLIGENDDDHRRVLTMYAEYSDGDMRKALHWMQCLHGLHVAAAENSGGEWTTERGATLLDNGTAEKLNDSTALEDGKGGKKTEIVRCSVDLANSVLFNMSAHPSSSVIDGLMRGLFSDNMTYAQWYRCIQSRICSQGYSIVACLQMICTRLLTEAASNTTLLDAICDYLERLAEIDAALHQGADGNLQILSLFHPNIVKK